MRRGWRRRIRLRDERCARREEARREEARGSRRGRVRAVPTVTGRVRVLKGPGGCLGPQEGVSSVESSDDFAQPFPCPANARFDGGLR